MTGRSGMRRIAVIALVSAAALVASQTAAAGGEQTVTLDGQIVILENQGEASKIKLRENTGIDCEAGSIRVARKVELSSGKTLNLTAPAGQAILAVSIKSGSNYTLTVTFSGNGAYVVVSKDISNYVVVYCVPKDDSNPICVLTGSGTNGAGKKYIQVTVQDPQTGIQSIVIDEIENASYVIAPFPYVGSLNPVVITATKLDGSQRSFLKLTVTNVSGESTTCDPPVPAVTARKHPGRRDPALHRAPIDA